MVALRVTPVPLRDDIAVMIGHGRVRRCRPQRPPVITSGRAAGDQLGKEYQSGRVDHPLSLRRAHRPREHRLAGIGVPADDWGARVEDSGDGGHRGGAMPAGPRLVWSWYRVAVQVTASTTRAKLLELLAFVR